MPGCNERLPVELDPFRMAELGRQFKGCIDFKQMQRLLPALESKQGQVETELTFDIDGQGIAFLQGEIRAELVLLCQRCLGEMQFPVVTEFRLALLRHESEVEQLSEEYEPLIVTTVPVRLAEILEDELLLALPGIPKHNMNECLSPDLTREEETQQDDESAIKLNPFAALADLKKEH